MTVLGYNWSGIAHFAAFAKLAEKQPLVERPQTSVPPETSVPSDARSEVDLAGVERMKPVTEFFCGLLHEQRPIFPRNYQPELNFIDEARARRVRSAAALVLMRHTITALNGEIEAARVRRAQARRAWMLHRLGVKARTEGPVFTNLKAIDAAISEHTAEIERLRQRLAPAVQLAEQKFHDYTRMSACPDWLERVAGSSQWADWLERIELLKSTLRALEPIFGHLATARKSFYLGSVGLENYRLARHKRWANKQFALYVEEYKAVIAHVEQLSRTIPYPLQDGRGFLHLAGYFVAGNDQPGPVGRFQYLRSIYQRSIPLYRGIVMELLEKLEAVENGARLEIPRPNLGRRS
jgi:hypothetical protein